MNLFILGKINEHGVWAHDFDQSDIMWFSPFRPCATDGNYASFGGDAFLFAISTNLHSNGGWCDWTSTEAFNFICESVI